MTSQAPTSRGPTDAGLTARVLSSEWQTMDTAPKDRVIILTDGKQVEAGRWAPDLHGEKYPWAFIDDYTPQDSRGDGPCVIVNAFGRVFVTHWMPLPTPPTNKGAA